MGQRIIWHWRLRCCGAARRLRARKAADTALFASDQPIHIALRGPISAIARTPDPARTPRPASLTLLSPGAETLAIPALAARDYAPPEGRLRLSPAARRIHREAGGKRRCSTGRTGSSLRPTAGTSPQHQQFVLSRICGLSHVQPADSGGPPRPPGERRLCRSGRTAGHLASRLFRRGRRRRGEAQRSRRNAHGATDFDLPARPHGGGSGGYVRIYDRQPRLVDASRPGRATSAATISGFLARRQPRRAGLVPVPYDFDFSGLVNAPHALPARRHSDNSVRQRYYHDYCVHNRAASSQAAAEFRAKRSELLGGARFHPAAGRRPSAAGRSLSRRLLPRTLQPTRT